MEELESALAREGDHERIQLHDLIAAVKAFGIEQQLEFAVGNARIKRPGIRCRGYLVGLGLAWSLNGLRRLCRSLGLGLLFRHLGRIGGLGLDFNALLVALL